MIINNPIERYFFSNTGAGNSINTIAGNDSFAIWLREKSRKLTGKSGNEESKHLISDRFRDIFLSAQIYFRLTRIPFTVLAGF